jgi:dienelactone hydrolase
MIMRRSRWAGVVLAVVTAVSCSASSSENDTASPPTTDAEREPTKRVVRIPAEGLELEGDLRVPGGVGPFPAVVLIAGSGPLDRDETLSGQLNMQFGFELPVFAKLGDAFRDAGFVVLTYDKRSCGTFNDCAENDYPVPSSDQTIETYIADAAAALEWLADQPEVDPARIVPVGHSEGGSFVPVLLDRDPSLAAGVIIAGAFDRIDVVLADQAARARAQLVELELPADQIEVAMQPLDNLAAEAAAIAAGTFTGTPTGGVGVEYWQSWLALGDQTPEVTSRVSQPVLVISGDRDWNVPTHQTEAFGAALTNSDVQVKVMPCVTHALNCVATDDLRAISSSDIGRDLDADFVEAIVAFLVAHV